MSSKTQTTAPPEEATPALVPKLRFPGFQDDWEMTPIGEKVDLLSGYPFDGPDICEDRRGVRLLRGINITEGRIRHSPEIDRYYTGETGGLEKFRVRLNDLVIGMDGSKVGKNSSLISDDDADALLIQRVARLRTSSPTLIQFIFQQINSTTFHSYVDKINTSSGIPHISAKQIKEFTVGFPSPAEQQKIAECLSSVDELMAAQARKVDALKTHKKGLMQQLFPREGETQPRLRFPEFQNAGEWEVRTIGEMFSLINGCAFKPEDWKPTGTPIIRIQNLNDPSAEFNYSQEPVPERNRVESGDLLFAWSGTLGSSFGARIWNGPSGVLNQHIFKVLMDDQQIILQFALLVLARVEEEIARRTHGFKASFVHVKKADLVQVEMLLPSIPEQQRIATCLSSLDALITAETQKHEALKTHKKGLMQQLFPSPEEVGA
ncbi:MAG: restriction endonuclease subunit S [Prosthecobacter sp.]